MSHEVKQMLTCGGFGEAEISRVRAGMVVKHMDRRRYVSTLVHIGQDGWFAETEGGALPGGQGRFRIYGRGWSAAHV